MDPQYTALMLAAAGGEGLAPSQHAGLLGLLSLLYAAVAAYVGFSLLDAQPPAELRARVQRRVLAALVLGSALLAASWIALLGLVSPQPLDWRWDATGVMLLGALLSAVAYDQRNRSIGFYAAASLPLGICGALAHQWLFVGVAGDALNADGGASRLVAWGMLLGATALAFMLATYFRRRRSGSPLFLTLAASAVLASGVWAHHGTLLAALTAHPDNGRLAAADAQLGALAGLGLLLLLAAVAVTARRRRAGEPSGNALRQGSRTEPTTGLPTLDVLSESFVRVLRLAVAARGEVALAVLHFAALDRIQSTQGRGERDRLFSLAAWRLRTVRRDEELLGAMGDNRLIVVLRVSDAGEATQRIRDLVKLFENPLGEGDAKLRLRPSAGVSLWPSHGDDFSRLLANALVALERCPPAGLQLFHATQREENEHRLRVESTLSSAIAQGELGLVLQPMVDALSGEVRMVELLARWNSSELGNVEPRQFILIAESSGVIGEFDRWLLREAISTTKWLDAAGFVDIRVALNCSPVNLVDERFLEFFEHAIRESSINPARIEVEVTEAALAEGEQLVVSSLLRLRALGLGITIDDFGIGHSSLARLRDLPVDSLKIDQSFVRDMDHPKGEFLVSGILGLAHGLGKAVIAEGVETDEQRRALTDLGCEYLQGYLISRPLSWRALLDFLGANAGGASNEADSSSANDDTPQQQRG